MFSLTIKDLYKVQEAFNRLTSLDNLAPAIKLRLVPIKRSFDQHLEDANNARLDIFKRFGEKLPGTGNYQIPENASDEIKDAVYDGWQAILDESVSIPGKRVPFETVAQASYLAREGGRAQLTVGDLLNLDWIIEMPASEDAETEAPAEAMAAHA